MTRYLAALFTLFPVLVFGQTEFGIKGGLNISDIVMTNYIDPDVEADLALKLGLHAGLFVNGMVNERVGMAAELLYSNKGVNANGKIHLHYITLPFLVQYQLADNIFAELGPEPGYLFSARSQYGSAANTYNNKFDLSLDGGFRFNSAKLVFGLRYCVGVFSVREPIEIIGVSGSEKIKYQNRVLQFWIGYKL
jgi:hypothetical protein